MHLKQAPRFLFYKSERRKTLEETEGSNGYKSSHKVMPIHCCLTSNCSNKYPADSQTTYNAMSDLLPLVLHAFGATANPWKVALILEELGLPYQIENVQMEDTKKQPFLSLNPNGKVPVLKDPNRNIVLWEASFVRLKSHIRLIASHSQSELIGHPSIQSGAIIDYLVDDLRH